MKKMLYSVVAVLAIGLLGSASICEAAMEIYLQIPEIPGDVYTDKVHQNWIVVESISHQLEQAESTYSGTRTAGKVHMGNFVIVKRIDRASPKLYLFGCNGRQIPEMTVDVVTTTSKGKIIFMQYKLKGVMVTSVQPVVVAGEDRPSETVSFNFGKIEWNYTQIGPDGAPKGDIKTFWDVWANTGG